MIQVETAEHMLNAVHDEVKKCDALVMTAAVADWTPTQVEVKKRKKKSTSPILNLKPTVDILLSLQDLKGDRLFVGFAAETDHVVEEASRKLEEKNLDLVVANDVTEEGSGFGADTNRVTFIMKNEEIETLPMMSKYDVAARIVQWLSTQSDA